MFGSAEIKSGVIGAGIVLSALGLAGESKAAEPAQAGNRAAATAQLDPGRGLLNQASGVERFSGPLKDALPPVQDGPVPWRDGMSSEATAALLGVLGGITGAAMGSTLDSRNSSKGMWIGAALGMGIPAGIEMSVAPARVIEFSTVIQEVQREDPPHYETRPSGKTSITSGPYYSQIVSIPESDVPLATNSYKVPLIPGQKVNARFTLDAENHIISWSAQPGNR